MAASVILKPLAQLSSEDETDVQHAIEILVRAECREVYLFGSMATGHATADSDLDLAIRGCPKGRFFEF
jgi:predicted nucleotidyltransferase